MYCTVPPYLSQPAASLAHTDSVIACNSDQISDIQHVRRLPLLTAVLQWTQLGAHLDDLLKAAELDTKHLGRLRRVEHNLRALLALAGVAHRRLCLAREQLVQRISGILPCEWAARSGETLTAGIGSHECLDVGERDVPDVH